MSLLKLYKTLFPYRYFLGSWWSLSC